MKSKEPDLMTPAQVAAIFSVDPKTVARWANVGKIDSIRTLGGHRRFRREDVTRLAREAAGSQSKQELKVNS